MADPTTDKRKADEQYTRYVYCRDHGHMPYVRKADKCYSFVIGEQYSEEDLAKLIEERRPALTINKVLGTLSNILGEQINLRNEISFKGRYGAPSGNADTLTKLFKYISQKNGLDWVRSDVFCDGGITSRGYYDVRMNFDKNLSGDVEIGKINPKNVLPDPDATEYDPDSWNDVIVTKWVTIDDIEYMYSDSAAKELSGKVTSSWAYGYDSIDYLRDRFGMATIAGATINTDSNKVLRLVRLIERQHRKLAQIKYFVNLRTGDKQEIPTSFDRDRIAFIIKESEKDPRNRLAVVSSLGKKIQWTTTADDLVLHDKPSPYKHFTVVPYFPYFFYGRTVGLIENLIGPQELLNKSTSQELHVVNTVANSGWKLRKGALQNMGVEELEAYGSKSGLVLELDDVNNAEKITPNTIPQGLSELSRKGENYIKSVSMRGDAQTGMARADVSADQIEAQKANSDIGLAKALDNLKRTDHILARNVLDLVREFITDPRAMAITHNELTGEQTEITINWPDPETGGLVNDVTLGEYDIVVVNTPAKQTLEESQFEQAAYMKEKLGIPIPDEFLIENSNLINKTGLVTALRKQAESAEAKAQKQMEIMGQQLQLAELKAETAKQEADALLKRAKTTKELAEVQNMAGGDATKQAEMELEGQKFQQESVQKQQAHEQDLQHQREKHAMEMEMKQKQAEDDRIMKRAQALAALRGSDSKQNNQSTKEE